MGLLLGCSVVTIFEILDLVIYNATRKCHERSENKKYRQAKKKRHKEFIRHITMMAEGKLNPLVMTGSPAPIGVIEGIPTPDRSINDATRSHRVENDRPVGSAVPVGIARSLMTLNNSIRDSEEAAESTGVMVDTENKGNILYGGASIN